MEETKNFKSGFVSIIGRTNVGKSTLINSLVGEKVAIMANKTQTTRTAIRAIVNRKNSQIVFIDTPGIHKPKTKLGNSEVTGIVQSVVNDKLATFLEENPSVAKEIFSKEQRESLERKYQLHLVVCLLYFVASIR